MKHSKEKHSINLFPGAALACLAIAASPGASANPWADGIVHYSPGTNPVPGFTNPAAALGEPTRITNPGSPFAAAVTPFQPAFGTSDIVSIGEGGSLTVRFDEPVTDDAANPFGIDLLIFGNSFYSDASAPNGVVAALFAEGGTVELSANGTDFFVMPGISADGAYPTLSYADVGPYATAAGSVPTDFTLPVDPALDPVGLSYAELMDAYTLAGTTSGGGVGIDLGDLGLPFITHVRISNAIGSGVSPEIDGFADVAPAVPTPGTAAVLMSAVVGIARRRR